jgi:hypothetical protein
MMAKDAKPDGLTQRTEGDQPLKGLPNKIENPLTGLNHLKTTGAPYGTRTHVFAVREG